MAANALSRTLKRKLQVADLQPLYIPSKEQDLVPKVTSAEFKEPHPGDCFLVDSDKPHWTPTIRVAFTGSMSSLASQLAPSRTSSASTLVGSMSVGNMSPNLATTPASGCDMYGWEAGLEQKLTLESQGQSGLGISMRPKCPYGQPKPRGLFHRVFSPKF